MIGYLSPAQVLDNLTPSATAYGLRKLRTAYSLTSPAYPAFVNSSYVPSVITNPLIRIRRSSDDALQDFTYNTVGDLDTVALLNFIGGPNLFTYSEQFNNSVWGGLGGTITANSVAAPNGSMTADAFTEIAGNNEHFIDYNYTTPSPASAYTMSVFVKPINNTNRYFILRAVFADGSGSAYSTFDLNTGTLISTTGSFLTNISITPSTAGWYFIRGTYTTGATVPPSIDLIFRLQFMEVSPLANVYNGNAAISTALWGAQLQKGQTYPGYTPTQANAQLVVPNGYVYTWFDQSGNARHLTQINQDNQPLLVDSGRVIRTISQRPTVRFTGDGNYTGSSFLYNSSASIATTNSTINMVTKWNSFNGTFNNDVPFGIGTAGDTRRGRFFLRSPNNDVGYGTWANDALNSGVNTSVGLTHHIYSAIQTATQVLIAKDGVESAVNLALAPLSPTTGIGMGQLYNPALYNDYFSDVDISEGIVFPVALTPAEKRLLHCDQGNYFNLPTTISGLDFYIAATADTASCKLASEQVVWNSSTKFNIQETGNNLQKLNSYAWDGGAASLNTVNNNGYFEFKAIETNKARHIGLSTSFTGLAFANIQYGIYLQNNSIVSVYESGVNRGAFGTYYANDVFRVAVESGIVKYYKNGVLFYTSTVLPLLPLVVHATMFDVGATVSSPFVYNPTNGTFTAYANNTGPNPVFQWKVNGVNTGTNSNVYTNNNLALNDVVSCQLSLNACTTNSIISNSITQLNVAPNPSLTFYIRPLVDTSACKTVAENVVWRYTTLDNMSKLQVNGNSLTKLLTNAWDAAGFSYQSVGNNGWMQFIAAQTNKPLMCGLSASYTGNSYTNIQYAIYLAAGGSLQVYESGVNRGTFGSYSVNDTLRIAVENNLVCYYRNNIMFYNSTVAPVLPLFVHANISDIGGVVSNVIVNNRSSLSFSAYSINAPTNVIYDWKVNNLSVQTGTSAIYSNSTLSNNDVVTCVLQLAGCLNNAFSSNAIVVKNSVANPSAFYFIKGVFDASGCKKAGEQVVWKYVNLSNYDRLIISGNTITKKLTAQWDAGAISANTVYNNGYFEFKAVEVNKNRMAGLSSSYTGASYANIDYAIYLQSNGTISIYEVGINRGVYGTYASNDIFRVAIDNNIVRYYKNGTIFFTSAIPAPGNLFVTASLFDIGATVADAYVWNLNNATFTAVVSNVYVPYTLNWKVNGIATGATGVNYSNPALAPNDVINCDLQLNGCYSNTLLSNTIVYANQTANPSAVGYIKGIVDSAACSYAGEQVVWAYTNLYDKQKLTYNGNGLTKLLTTAWDAGAFSYNTVGQEGFLEFRVGELNKGRMVGLSTNYGSSSYTTIQYAVYLQSNGTFSVYESGTNRASFTTYALTDTFRIAVEGNQIKYYRNRELFYTSLTQPNLPLYVNASLNDLGATVLDAIVWNLNSGSFSAVFYNGSPALGYDWKVNGVSTGAVNVVYSNPSLTNADVVSCDISYTGCVNTVFPSNLVKRRAVEPNPSLSFFIYGIPDQSSCRMAGEEVVWKRFTNFNDLTKIQKNTNNLTKLGAAGWDAGAISLNKVSNNGFMEFTASETNKARMVGLSATYASSSYTTIQYAIYLQSNATIGIYESGTSRGTFGAYATGDVLRVAIESGVVKYYRNGTLLYTSTVIPSLPLSVNASLSDMGATITNVMVYNYNTGSFMASAAQAGKGVTYTWMVNGIVMQSGVNPAYNNSTLNLNDLITCRLTLGGCLTAYSYLSNSIIIKAAPQQTADFFIEGSPVLPGCKMAIEQVKWKLSDLISNVSIVNTNSLVRNNGTGAWNAGAASWNTVANFGYFEFTATENNKLRCVGLSATNNASDQLSIQYAFYLQNDGNYRIYESGIDRGLIGPYQTNAVFKIKVDGGVVKYFKDGLLVYLSNISPNLPLLVDISLNELGATITNAKVANYNNGRFQSNILNGGTYNWLVNGVLMQAGLSSVYLNNGLSNHDTVICQLTSNLPGCNSQFLTSNYIENVFVAPDSVDAFIKTTYSASSCFVGIEQVKWKTNDLNKYNTVVRPDNSLLKMQSGGAWNGGAASWNTVQNNGYFEFKAIETNKWRAIGLSSTNTGSDLATIQFAIVLNNTGNILVYESNNNRGGFGIFSTNDVFRIAVENNVVKYYRNGSLFYISNVTPSLPLLVDVSLYDLGATVVNPIVANYFAGSFQASATNAGASPNYQFLVNSTPVQNGLLSSYTNSTLNIGDTVSCVITSNVNGCMPFPFASNYIVVANASPANFDFSITSNPSLATCATVTEPVKWKLSDLSKDAQIINGNGLTRAQNFTWNCGAFSWNKVFNNGYMEFTVAETNKARMIGLSSTNPNADWLSIQYAIYLTNTGTFDIRQSGTTIAIPAAVYTTNDVFKIAVESNVVKYYKNGSLIYSSLIVPTLPLMVDVSLYEQGATVKNAVITNYSSGVFNANCVNGGANPIFNWKLNGLIVQSGLSATYTNLNLINGDVVSCEVQASPTGCNSLMFASNTITNNIIPQINVDFAIRGVAVSTSCSVVSEKVKWKISDLSTCVSIQNINQLIKSSAPTTWDGGAASWNTVSNNGYFQCTAAENNKARMIGLSSSNTGYDQNSIRYAFLLDNNATYRVYEAGVFKGVVSNYAVNDTFKIAVESNVVKYFVNNVLVYASALVPTLPLLVDVSLYDVGSTITNPYVVNYNGGSFEAVSVNAGLTPVYDWKVNGISVQTSNLPTYTNTGLQNLDIVTCSLTPNLAGCNNNLPIASNELVNGIVAPTNIDCYLRGVPVTTSCNYLVEEVKWKTTDCLNTKATTNNLVKVQSDGVWDGGAASWNTVAVNGSFQFTVSENNKARVAGLSTTNANALNTSVGFAFHLLSTGELRIVESGVDRGYSGSYVPSDVLKITVEVIAAQNRARYYKNNVLLYTSTINIAAASLPMLVDVSIYNQGGTITNALVSNPNNGSFTVGATNVGTGNYTWKVNGVVVQSGTTTTYTNTLLASNDQVTCSVVPGLNGCAGIIYNSNNTKYLGTSVIVNNPAPVCSPATVDLTNTAVTAGTSTDITLSYWMDALATTAIPNPMSVGAGTYYIKGTRLGCTDIKPVTVVVNPSPIVDITSTNNNHQLDCNVTSIVLTATGAGTLNWEDNSNNAIRTVNQPGTYIATYTSLNGCSTSTNFVVYKNIEPPIVEILGNTSPICQGASVTLTANPSTLNNAIRFDGTSQNVDLGNWFNYRNFSIEMWLKPGAIQTPNACIMDDNYWFTGRGWICQQNNTTTNQYIFSCYTPYGSAGVTFNLTANVWQHVTLVKSNTAIQVYINGVLAVTTPWNYGAIYYDGSQFLRLGRWGGGGRYWSGQMDEVRIFNADISAAQIASDMNANYPQTTNNLTAYYKMDEPDNAAAIVNSSSVSSRDGITVGNPNFLKSGTVVTNSFNYNWNPSGSTNASISFTPTSPIVYYSSVTGNNGCVKTESSEVTVSLNGSATIAATTNTACLNGTSPVITLTGAGATAPYTFYYAINGVNYTVTSAGTNSFVNIMPPTNSVGTFVYDLKNLTYSNASFCLQAQSGSYTLTVKPNPVVAITTPPAVCQPGGINLTLPSITNGSSTGVNFNYYSNITATNAIALPNNVTTAGTYYIQAVDTSSGCKTIAPVNVVINPKPYLSNVSSPDICSGATSNVLMTSNTPSSFIWGVDNNPSNVTGVNNGVGNSINQTLINPLTNAPASVSYYVIPTASATGCIGDTDLVTVTVNPLPSIISTAATKICTSGTATLQATPSAGNVQWYSTANGGSPLLTSVNYTTPTINTSTTYYAQPVYGSCSNGVRTPVNVLVENPGQWLGYTNDWNTLANWGCNQLPTATTNVIIPTVPDGGFFPIVFTNALALCKNLQMNPSSSVTINAGKDLNVYGDIINNGLPNLGKGKLSLSGNVLQYISGPNTLQLNHLLMNNSKTGNAVKLNVDVQVDSILEFNAGRLCLNGKNLTLGTIIQDGLVLGAGINKHLNAELGYFIKHTNSNSSYVLPLGDSTDYTPFSISFNNGTQNSSAIRSKVTKGKEPNLIVSTDYLNRYWTIEPINLLSNCNYDVVYNYQNATDVIGTGVLYPIKYNSLAGWSGCPGSNATNIAGLSGAHNAIAKSFAWYGLTSFSNFTGAGNSSPLPIQLLSFNAIKNNLQVDCKWSTAIESNNDFFTIERSDDAINFSPIGIVDGAGNSNSILNYSFSDFNPIQGINYYRLRQTDFDGHTTWSEIKSVNMDKSDAIKLLMAYFDNNDLHISFNQETAIVEIKLYDVLGREVYHNSSSNSKFITGVYNISNLSSGNYLLSIQTANASYTSKIFK
ncbi:MAG: LamG-like jellyroll fold domain-containing protein [Bacteroidota bacterium]